MPDVIVGFRGLRVGGRHVSTYERSSVGRYGVRTHRLRQRRISTRHGCSGKPSGLRGLRYPDRSRTRPDRKPA